MVKKTLDVRRSTRLVMRATSLLVFICYFVLPSVNKDFTYLLTYLLTYVYPTIDVNFSILTKNAKFKSFSTIFSLQIFFVINVLNYKTIIALKLA